MGGVTPDAAAAALTEAGHYVVRSIWRGDGKHLNVNVRFRSGLVKGCTWLAADGLKPVLDWVAGQTKVDDKIIAGKAACEQARAKR